MGQGFPIPLLLHTKEAIMLPLGVCVYTIRRFIMGKIVSGKKRGRGRPRKTSVEEMLKRKEAEAMEEEEVEVVVKPSTQVFGSLKEIIAEPEPIEEAEGIDLYEVMSSADDIIRDKVQEFKAGLVSQYGLYLENEEIDDTDLAIINENFAVLNGYLLCPTHPSIHNCSIEDFEVEDIRDDLDTQGKYKISLTVSTPVGNRDMKCFIFH